MNNFFSANVFFFIFLWGGGKLEKSLNSARFGIPSDFFEFLRLNEGNQIKKTTAHNKVTGPPASPNLYPTLNVY